MKKIFTRVLLLALVLLGGASTASAQTSGFDVAENPLSRALLNIIVFINEVVVPLVFALAFIVFIWGIFQAFFLGANDEEKRTNGKTFILWGIIALFVMSSLWGLVNLAKDSFGFGSDTAPCVPTFGTAEPCAKAPAPTEKNGPVCPPGETCFPGTDTSFNDI